MTIKENNWQERFDAGVHLEFGSTSPDQIKNFISTLLEEERQSLLSELIEEIGSFTHYYRDRHSIDPLNMPPNPDGLSEMILKEEIINKLKSKQQ